MEAVASQYRKAADAGFGEEDMAAVFRAFRPAEPLHPREH
jgi:3-hydroxyisobutyrate dehydrogenase-like beta-hydroxyacid dehydrogenase